MKATIRGIQVEGTVEEVTKLIREFETVVGVAKINPEWLKPCGSLYPYVFPGTTCKTDNIQ